MDAPTKEMKTCRRRCKKTNPFNKLTDDLLISILSFLPACELVRSSAVCPRWRPLWTHSSRLDLRCPDRKHGLSSSLSSPLPSHVHEHHLSYATVNKILRSNSACKIHTCIIDVHPTLKMYPSLYEFQNLTALTTHRKKIPWITILRKKNIEKLWLRGCISLSMPTQIFSLSSLQELVLYDLAINGKDLDLSKLVCLRTLRLIQGSIFEILLADIVSALPCLERLCIWQLRGETIEVRSNTLKQLEIGMLSLKMLEIYAPALSVLAMNVGSKKFVIHAPSLTVLKTDLQYNDIAGFFRNSHQKRIINSNSQKDIEFLEQSVSMYKHVATSQHKINVGFLLNLRKLSLSINLNDVRQTVMLAFAMMECLLLEQLDITVDKKVILDTENNSSCLPYPEGEYWRRQTTCQRGCLSHQLEYVMIYDFKGESLELEFIRFLMMKAMLLKKLVIWHQCSGKELEALSYLLLSTNIPYSSPDLDITVHPEVKEWTGKSLISNACKCWLIS